MMHAVAELDLVWFGSVWFELDISSLVQPVWHDASCSPAGYGLVQSGLNWIFPDLSNLSDILQPGLIRLSLV